MLPVQTEYWVDALSGLQQQMENQWGLIGTGCYKGTRKSLTYFMILLQPALLLPTSLNLLLRLRYPFGQITWGPVLTTGTSKIIFPSRLSSSGTEHQMFPNFPAEPVQCLFSISYSCLFSLPPLPFYL